MTQHRYERKQQLRSDNSGNLTFVERPPTAQDLYITATFQILEAGSSGIFVATTSDGTGIGYWAQGQAAGPWTWPGNLDVTVQCKSLLPNTLYTLQIIGYSDSNISLVDALPSGTGTSALFGHDAITQLANQPIGAAGAVVYPGPANVPTLAPQWFPCLSFAALRLAVSCLTGGPIVIECMWSNQDLNATMGYRKYIVGDLTQSGSILQVVIPHLGDQLSIKVSNQTPEVPATFSICATHTTQPLAMFGGLDIDNSQGFSLDAGQTLIVLAPPYIYGGPAHLSFNPGGFSAAYVVSLEAQQEDGSWNAFEVRSNADPGVRQDIDFFCPAQPIRLTATNNTGDTQTGDAVLEYDLHRVG